jgi:hypothetical protein
MRVVSFSEFKAMARRGRIHCSYDDMVKPSKADLKRAKTPIELGWLYGYSENDIAHFYLVRCAPDARMAYANYIRDLARALGFKPSRPKGSGKRNPSKTNI